MPGTVKTLIGFGSLDAGASTWWNWKVTDNDVYVFWVDVHGAAGNTLEIVHTQNVRETINNRAYINIKNLGTKFAQFSVNVVRIF